MSRYLKVASVALVGLATCLPLGDGPAALDMNEAHETAIRNCVNWNGETQEYCSCVQDKVRADLTSDSYMAMMQYAQAYQENRRADLAAMQVDAGLSKALEPVDAVVTAAQRACKS